MANPPARPLAERGLPAIMALGLAAWWLLCIVDSAFEQAQIALFGGYILLPRWTLQALFLATLPALLVIRGWGGGLLPRTLLLAWLAFGSWLAIDTIFLEARLGGVSGDLTVGYYRSYFLLMAFPLGVLLRGSLPVHRVTIGLLLVAVPLGTLGLFQYGYDDPLLPTSALNTYWEVLSLRLDGDGNVRAFSLFNSGLTFGHFMSFVGALAVCLLLRRDIGIVPALALIGLSGACIYASLTRVVYLVAGAALITALVMVPRRRPPFSPPVAAMPVVWGVLGYLVATGIKDFLDYFRITGGDNLLSSASLDVRQQAWEMWAQELFSSFSNALFGAAITPRDSGSLAGESTILIDNGFIEVSAQVGLIGAALWMLLLWQVWRFVLAEAQRRQDALSYAIAAIWATWPLSLMFGTTTSFYALIALLSLLTRSPQGATAPRASSSA